MFTIFQAEFNRLSAGHRGSAPLEAFLANNGTDWSEFVHSYGTMWEAFYTNWLNELSAQDRIVVHYSSLKKQPEPELKRVLQFLDMTTSEKVMRCVLDRKEGVYKRKKRNLTENVVTSHMMNFMRKRISDLNAKTNSSSFDLLFHLL